MTDVISSSAHASDEVDPMEDMADVLSAFEHVSATHLTHVQRYYETHPWQKNKLNVEHVRDVVHRFASISRHIEAVGEGCASYLRDTYQGAERSHAGDTSGMCSIFLPGIAWAN